MRCVWPRFGATRHGANEHFSSALQRGWLLWTGEDFTANWSVATNWLRVGSPGAVQLPPSLGDDVRIGLDRVTRFSHLANVDSMTKALVRTLYIGNGVLPGVGQILAPIAFVGVLFTCCCFFVSGTCD